MPDKILVCSHLKTGGYAFQDANIFLLIRRLFSGKHTPYLHILFPPRFSTIHTPPSPEAEIKVKRTDHEQFVRIF